MTARSFLRFSYVVSSRPYGIKRQLEEANFADNMYKEPARIKSDDPLSAHSHEWSRHLCSMEQRSQDQDGSKNQAAPTSVAKTVEAVQSAKVDTDSGVIKMDISASPSTGYGTRCWGLWVGGHGLGSDEDALWGGPKRAPIAVRFVAPVPFSVVNVDDTGYVSADFWEHCLLQTPQPSLANIVEQAVSWLDAAHAYEGESKEEATEKYLEAEKYTAGKLSNIATFREEAAPHPHLLLDAAVLTEADLDGAFVPCMGLNNNNSDRDSDRAFEKVEQHIHEVSLGVFSFPLFTESFCAKIIDTIDAFEASPLPKRRPNTMNNYGMVTNDIGLKPLMDNLLARVIAPFARRYFAKEPFARSLDHHHSFAVVYKGEELGTGDRGLDMHHDAAEVTMNVCLGRHGFEASGLRFCGQFGKANHRQQQYTHAHTIGSAVVHLGRHRHGADSIASGERINLIMWARSSSFRAAAAYQHLPPDGYPKEGEFEVPHRLCLSKANDGDYEAQLKAFESSGATITPAPLVCSASR